MDTNINARAESEAKEASARDLLHKLSEGGWVNVRLVGNGENRRFRGGFEFHPG